MASDKVVHLLDYGAGNVRSIRYVGGPTADACGTALTASAQFLLPR
jgi:hypothetical protein